MRSTIALTVALVLWSTPLVSLADGSIPPLTYTTIADRDCSFKALSPLRLHLLEPPDECGVGRWIPEGLYLKLYKDALSGIDCDADIESAVSKTRAAVSVGLAAAEAKSELFKVALDDCEDHRNPSILKRLLSIGAGGLIGLGTGTAGGAVAAAFTDLDWDQGLGGGAVLGFVSGIVSAVIVDALRQ